MAKEKRDSNKDFWLGLGLIVAMAIITRRLPTARTDNPQVM
jgi:hypothetical protein